MSITEDAAYDMFGDELLETYETLYGAFESVVADPEGFIEDFTGEWIETFIEVAKENVAVSSVQIDGILVMTSAASDGIVRIKKALETGLAAGEDSDVEISCVGCPRYRIVVKAGDYKEAEEIMKNVSTAAIDNLVAAGGTAVLKRENK